MPDIFSRARKEQIRHQLISEGRYMMLKEGITGMNLENLAKSAGIAKGTFYNFFQNKQKFIIEIIRDFQNEKINQIKELVYEKHSKLTVKEAIKWYKDFIVSKNNPRLLLSKKDIEWILKKISLQELFNPEADLTIINILLSCVEGVNKNIDYKVLSNFPKMLALAIGNMELMHKEVLNVNIDMIMDLMAKYISGQL